jgi:hypothetical protein
MTPEELQAYITVGAALVGDVKDTNSALRATKKRLLAAMEDIGTDAIDSTTRPGVGIAIAPAQVTIDLDQLNDETIVYLARKGALRTSRTAWATLNEEERASLAAFVTFAPAAAEFYFNVNKKGEQIAPTPAQKPPVSIAGARLGRDAAVQAGSGIIERPQPRQGAAQPAQQVQSAGLLTCPDHPAREPKGSKWGGSYCTAQLGEQQPGEEPAYCKWTSKRKAS